MENNEKEKMENQNIENSSENASVENSSDVTTEDISGETSQEKTVVEEQEEEFEIAANGIGSEPKSEEAKKEEEPEEEMEGFTSSFISQNVGKAPEDPSDPEVEKRETRKSRRVRNQVICYAALMAMMVVGGVVVSWTFENYVESKREAQQIAEESLLQQQAAMEQLVQNEEELVPPTPAPTPEATEDPSPEPVETVAPDEPTEEPSQTPEEIQIISKPANPEMDAYIDEMIAKMPLEDKVAGLFIITPEALTKNNTVTKAAGGTKSALNKYAVGGLIYAKKNLKSDAQVMDLIKNTNEFARYPLFMMVQEEGGSVAPLADAKLCEKVLTPEQIGQSGDPETAHQAGVQIGTSMSKYGLNVNYLPIGDLANANNSIMKNRVYGSDADTVIPYVEAVIQGLDEQQVYVCIGHFPGNGGVEAGSSVLVNNRSREELEAEEFKVMKAAVMGGADMVCISNVAVPAYTGDNTPAVFSDAIVTDLIRKEYGYDGLIISAPLNEAGVKDYYDSDEAAIKALRAGCDMILLPENFEKAYNGVLSAVADGTISEERINDALKRIYRVKLETMTVNAEVQ